MKDIKHFVVSDIDGTIAEFTEFNADRIKEVIVKQLQKEPMDIITHEKTSKDERYYGNDIINVYETNPANNIPSLVIQKAGKTYYKHLT